MVTTLVEKKVISSIVTIGAIIFFIFNFVFIGQVNAAEITNVNVENRNDFVLEPAKLEIILNPGEKATRYIYVTSRVNKPTKFRIDIEDFIGTEQEDKPVLLLGNDRSPYSLKDYLKPDITEFTLGFGQKIMIPVVIDLPPTAAPGGFYASVIISNAPDKLGTSTENTNQTRAVSRVGSLLFVRINGPVNENGAVEKFEVKDSKLFYPKADLTFNILFRNTGSVHLVPYGTIDIKNIWGKVVDTIPVDAYFSLPNSLRYREVPWQKTGLLGYYKAVLHLHQGYGDIVDEKSISLFIIPWTIILIIFGVILVLLFLYYYISRNFELKRK